MKKLSLERMERIEGGAECFEAAIFTGVLWDIYASNPTDQNFTNWLFGVGVLTDCMMQ